MGLEASGVNAGKSFVLQTAERAGSRVARDAAVEVPDAAVRETGDMEEIDIAMLEAGQGDAVSRRAPDIALTEDSIDGFDGGKDHGGKTPQKYGRKNIHRSSSDIQSRSQPAV